MPFIRVMALRSRGRTWKFMPHLSLAQFYKVAVDNTEPFYYVYGGTQDNYSLGGPSRTTERDHRSLSSKVRRRPSQSEG
jgi:hypothetical protein